MGRTMIAWAVALAASLGVIPAALALGLQENPPEGMTSVLAGVTVISGWRCNPGQITVRFDGGPPFALASGTPRNDTAGPCGNSGRNGYGALYNVNLLGDGTHVARFYDDGSQFVQVTFEVVTLGSAFAKGLAGNAIVPDFPIPGEAIMLRWVEGLQDFQIAAYCQGADCPVDRTSWGDCSWQPVGWLKSHGKNGDWCPDGTFLTQLDLDRAAGKSDSDNPVVGRAQCCGMGGAAGRSWQECAWSPVGLAKTHSHEGVQWCDDGHYLVQLDLDDGGTPEQSPIVGEARCCTIEGESGDPWRECFWTEVGPLASHQDLGPWCPEGSYLAQLDFDVSSLSDADDPVVGHAFCCRP